MGLLAVVVTIAFVALCGVVLVAARLQRRSVADLAVGLGLALCGWGALYGSILVGTSIAAEPRVLGLNEDKEYCGFYLDCHLHSAIVRVDTMRSVGVGSAKVEAAGVFVAVTVRVSSNALRSPMKFVGPRAVIRDSVGREYHRAVAAESARAASGAPARSLTDMIGPGESFESTLVFDVPRTANGLVLDLTDGLFVDRVLELMLIGDDDSFLHPRTVFRLRYE